MSSDITTGADRWSDSVFVRLVLGILATLVTAGIIGTLTVAFRINTQLGEFSAGQAAMVEQIRGLQSLVAAQSTQLKEMSDELKDTRGTVRALEMLTGRISENHTELKAEVIKLRDRLRDLEKNP